MNRKIEADIATNASNDDAYILSNGPAVQKRSAPKSCLSYIAIGVMALAAVFLTCAASNMHGDTLAPSSSDVVHTTTTATTTTAQAVEPIVLIARDYAPKKKCAPKQQPISTDPQAQAPLRPQVLVGQQPVQVTPVATEYIGKAPEKVTYLEHEQMTGNVTFKQTDKEQPFLYMDPTVPGFLNISCNATVVMIHASNLTALFTELDVEDHLLIPLDYPSCGQRGMLNGTMTTVPGYRAVRAITVVSEEEGLVRVDTIVMDLLANVDIDIVMTSHPNMTTFPYDTNVTRRWDKSGSHDFNFDHNLHWGQDFAWVKEFTGGAISTNDRIDFDLKTHFLYHVEWSVHIKIKWFKIDCGFTVGGNMDFELTPSMQMNGNFNLKAGIQKYTPVLPVFSIWGMASAGIYGSIELGVELKISGEFDVSLPITIQQQPWSYSWNNGKSASSGGLVTYEIDLDYHVDGKIIPKIYVMPGLGVGISVLSKPVAGVEVGFNSVFVDTLDMHVPPRDDCYVSNMVTYEGTLIVSGVAGFPTSVDSKLQRWNIWSKPLVPERVLDQRCLAKVSANSGPWSTGHVSLLKGHF
ncbi:hypothetical protein HDU81_009082 [Chytriomyces hyalinus]|nr:hypothetical protein HDU81_009082 [Chytriomyces hyalinus]